MGLFVSHGRLWLSPHADIRSGSWQNDGTFEFHEERNRHVVDVLYGWNSEDDLYFPTRGSSFHIGGGWGLDDRDHRDQFHLQFRKTWRIGDGFASFKLAGDPSPEYRETFSENQFLVGAYARPLAPARTSSVAAGISRRATTARDSIPAASRSRSSVSRWAFESRQTRSA